MPLFTTILYQFKPQLSVRNTLDFYVNQIDAPLFLYNSLYYCFIPLLLITILVLIFSLLIKRYLFDKLVIKKKDLDNQLNAFFTELFFSNYSAKEIKDQTIAFKQRIPFDKKWCKYLILKKLINIKQNINGVKPNQILLIYKYFGLESYSKKLIKSKKWYNKSLGIYHYQTLDYKIKKGRIKTYLKHKNSFLKSNTLIALISLSDEKFNFLDDYQEQISRAEELKILDIIYQNKSSLPKDISSWLYNKNYSIVILSIKLMIRYREPLNIAQIQYLLSSTNAMVRRETLLAIRELIIVEANELLINHYETEPIKRNKISALKTLGVLSNHQNIAFASDLLSKENDLEIKFEIIHCINKIDRSFFQNFKTVDPIENDIIKRIVLHVNNPHLN